MTEFVRKKGTRESLQVTAGHGTTMQVLISDEEAPNFAFRKFVMEPNGGMPRHKNLVEHEQFVLQGSGIIEIDGQPFEVAAGDAVFIPGNVSHSYQAGKDGLEFICVVPNQEDKIELLD